MCAFYIALALTNGFSAMPKKASAADFYPFFNSSNYREGLKAPVDQVRGIYLFPNNFTFDKRGVKNWKTLTFGKDKPNVVESLVIKGSRVKNKTVIIPPGGLYYDAAPDKFSIPVGGESLLFGKGVVLEKMTVQEETDKNFEIMAGHPFHVGNHTLVYFFPTKNGLPILLWQTFDGTSIREKPLTQYKSGTSPDKEKWSTKIRGIYEKASPKRAIYQSFSAPWISEETWKTENGKKIVIKNNEEMFPGYRVLPISCPIGHHIGLMVYNDTPIVLQVGKPKTLLNGYLKLRVSKIDKKGNVDFVVNGQKKHGENGINSVYGLNRPTEGILNTIQILNHLTRKN